MSTQGTRPARAGGRTVSELVAAGLAAAGVEWAFTVPGESFLGLLDALPRAGIRVIATRHEGGASFMAEAVGQLTGKPAACLGTRAVGGGNMAIGIHTARQNSTPMVALLGQVKRAFRGREAFQETDLVTSYGGLAKWAAEIDDPATAARLVGEGLTTMLSGRPGPILFSLPEDVLDEPLPRGAAARSALVQPSPPAHPDPATVARIIELLAAAQRPAIVAGGGVIQAGATSELVTLSERLTVPVFAAWRRPTVFPNDHPNYLGVTGYGAAATVLPRLRVADALLVVGSRLNEICSFDYRIPAHGTRWAHVDLEPRQAGAGLRAPTIPLAADAADFLRAVIEALPQGRRRRGVADQAAALAADRTAFEIASTLVMDPQVRGQGVNPARVVTVLQDVLPDNAIMTTDAGNFALWPARGFRFRAEMSFLGPTSGAMGYGLPAAIAASLCAPDRSVVALCGDGGFAMTMNELETAVRTGAHPVVLIFDNRRYGTIAMHQRNENRSMVATDLGPIDFAAVARASGAQGGRVTRDVELEPALRDALSASRPAVLQLEIDPRWITPDRFEA